jgi:tripartite-type tricarboxylate transporter receptor subunit TctC
LRTTLNDTKNHQSLIDSGAQPVGNTPAEHAALIKTEIAKWKRVANAAGLKPQ